MGKRKLHKPQYARFKSCELDIGKKILIFETCWYWNRNKRKFIELPNLLTIEKKTQTDSWRMFEIVEPTSRYSIAYNDEDLKESCIFDNETKYKHYVDEYSYTTQEYPTEIEITGEDEEDLYYIWAYNEVVEFPFKIGDIVSLWQYEKWIEQGLHPHLFTREVRESKHAENILKKLIEVETLSGQACNGSSYVEDISLIEIIDLGTSKKYDDNYEVIENSLEEHEGFGVIRGSEGYYGEDEGGHRLITKSEYVYLKNLKEKK